MIREHDYLELVQQAQVGDSQSLERLAEVVEVRIRAYVYRITLNGDMVDDVTQETHLEMVRSLKGLRDPKRFWSWIYRVAMSKVSAHFRNQRRGHVITLSALECKDSYYSARCKGEDGFGSLVRKEMREKFFLALLHLKPSQRAIISLRCFEEMKYSEIAAALMCSELQARVRFFRAKQALKVQLSRYGYSKATLLVVLTLFGRMTAPAEAAPVAVSAASTKVGFTAAVLGEAGSKFGLTVAAMFAAAFLSVGSLVFLNHSESGIGLIGSLLPERSEIRSFHFVRQAWDKSGSPNPNLARGRSLSKGAYEQWYYFPEGIDGAMFLMMQRWDPELKSKLCGWLQNSSGNYYYNSMEKKIYLYNHHLPMSYLNTRRLPSDTSEFTEFLDQIEGGSIGVDYIRDPETNLLVGALDNQFYNAKNFESSFSYNTLDEKSFDSFRYPWPEDAPVIDERDEMHKRGWTYFRITGRINGEKVQGYGQTPFIYDRYREHSPWLRLRIGEHLEIVDSSSGAYITSPDEKVSASYPMGSFFKGLARPWAGMHAIDVIRRDAAEKRIKFNIRNFGRGSGYYGKAEITLFDQTERGQTQIVYTVDLGKDVIEKIEFSVNSGAENNQQGVFRFTYLDDVESLSEAFTEPAKKTVRTSPLQNSMGILWLIELAQGTLG